MFKRIVAVSAVTILMTLTACKSDTDSAPVIPPIPTATDPTVVIDRDYDITPHVTRDDTAVTLTSPDGATSLILSVKNGQATYRVERNGKVFLLDGAMGLTVDDTAFGTIDSVAEIGTITGYRRTDTRPLNGRAAVATGECLELTVPVDGMTIETRLYRNGVAFRYHIGGNGSRTLASEQTTFHFPASSKIWAGTEHIYYETTIKSYPINRRPADRLTSPATVELSGGGFAAIVEGDLYNYPGLKLNWAEKDVFAAALPSAPYTMNGEITSAWRMIYVADDLNELVNNTMVYLVNAPAEDDFEWVEPGRAAWSWITGRTTDRVTYPLMETYTDYAAKLGLEYNIIDEGWASWSSRDALLKALTDKGKPYGVGQILWTGMKAGQGYNGTIDDLDEAKAYIDYVSSLGMAGAKIDFFVTEDSINMGVNIYKDILTYAAEKKIVINFHGCNKPTGADATYPNELNREAILGFEAF
ncbi:MAG: glycoside hydrolase family 97 N-terminal domain-containing protein [Clostridia bacterium]|nr:glycoside hydrolase family 97 N-terminal domain-containing protein [Clostridia bacterium]